MNPHSFFGSVTLCSFEIGLRVLLQIYACFKASFTQLQSKGKEGTACQIPMQGPHVVYVQSPSIVFTR